MTPSWYDLLDVGRDADADEIRAAWRERIDGLDPTDRRFAVLNRAAKVLLDPEARAAYDAELATADDPDDPDDPDDTAVTPARTATSTTPAKPTTPTTPTKPTRESRPTRSPARTPGARGSLLTAVLAGVLAVAFVVLAVVAWTTSRDESELADDTAAARTAAELAIEPILSYDATDLEAGRSSALSTLTDSFAEEYEALFDGIVEQNAPELGTRAEATYLASGVVRAEPGRVQVLVFVDQEVTNNASAEPRTFSNQVTVTMQEVGDRWLVDDLETRTGG